VLCSNYPKLKEINKNVLENETCFVSMLNWSFLGVVWQAKLRINGNTSFELSYPLSQVKSSNQLI
jgi:hypothetical protein